MTLRCPVCSVPARSEARLRAHLNEHAARFDAMRERGEKTTLAGYIKRMGSKEAAAASVGVSLITYWRWMKKKTVPRGNDARRLKELNIIV